MSTLTYFRTRPDYALGRAFALAFAVHAVLLAVLFLGVRWQSHSEPAVTVELWEPPPPPPPPAPVVEAPKPPPPVVEPPKPEVKKPDIVEAPKKMPPKKAEPKVDKAAERRAAAQLAAEQKKMREQLEAEQKRLAAEEQARADAKRKADAEKIARDLAAAANNRALADYVGRLRARVRQNWILPQDLPGNPEAVFDVVQLPTGEIITVKLARSSGNPAFDAAVERAILKSSPLPLPEPRSLWRRDLKLTFRPRD